MKIRKLVLSDFGKFHQEEIYLSPGLNIATGSNESGKTTLRRFIRSMFYGLERDRGIRARQDDYTRYKPWEYGRFQGSMELETEGRTYRLYRNFLTTEKQIKLTELATGREIPFPEQFLQEQGLPSEVVYTNTFWVGNSCATEGLLAQELKDYLANLAYSGGSGLNLQKSYVWLAARKKELERELPEAELRDCMELQLKKASFQQQLKDAYKTMKKQEQWAADKKKEVDRLEKQVTELLAEREQAEAGREYLKRGKWYIFSGAGLALILFVLGILFPQAILWLYSTGGLLLVLGVSVGLPQILRGRRGKEKERELLERMLEIKSCQQSEFEAALEQKVAVDRSMRTVEQLEEQLRCCEMAEKRYAELSLIQQNKQRELAAVQLATETIKRLSGELYEEFGMKFARALSSYVQDFTDHAYETLTAEENLTLRAVTTERTVTIPEVSFGTGEQFYLALRFAAADVFDPDKKNPIILDDSFASFDEQRLESAILALAKCGRQILLLSSTGREEQAAKRMGIPYETVF